MYFTIRPRDQYLGPDCLGMSTTEIVDCHFVPCNLQSVIPENSQLLACYFDK